MLATVTIALLVCVHPVVCQFAYGNTYYVNGPGFHSDPLTYVRPPFPLRLHG
jgi:hypothetical protein